MLATNFSVAVLSRFFARLIELLRTIDRVLFSRLDAFFERQSVATLRIFLTFAIGTFVNLILSFIFCYTIEVFIACFIENYFGIVFFGLQFVVIFVAIFNDRFFD